MGTAYDRPEIQARAIEVPSTHGTDVNAGVPQGGDVTSGEVRQGRVPVQRQDVCVAERSPIPDRGHAGGQESSSGRTPVTGDTVGTDVDSEEVFRPEGLEGHINRYYVNRMEMFLKAGMPLDQVLFRVCGVRTIE